MSGMLKEHLQALDYNGVRLQRGTFWDDIVMFSSRGSDVFPYPIITIGNERVNLT